MSAMIPRLPVVRRGFHKYAPIGLRHAASRMLGVLAGVVITLAVGAAAAQTASGNAAAAEALFEEGRTLMEQGKYDDACAKFEASHKLDPSVGALLNLGECRYKNGQTASSWAQYRQAAALANQRGDRRRGRFARTRAEAVARELSYLTIEVPDAVRVAGLAITLNNEPLDPALWNQRTPVDPGPYVIKLQAPGHAPQTLRSEVGARRDDVRVAVSALEPVPVEETDPTTTSPSEPQPAGGGNPTPASVTTGPRDSSGGLPMGRKVALALGAVGLAGITAGSVFGLQASSKWDEAQRGCEMGADGCGMREVDLSKEAQMSATVSTISFAVGLAAAAGATFLWLWSGPEERADGAANRAARIVPVVGPNGLGASVQLNF